MWGAGGVALVRGQGRGTWGGRAAWEGRVQGGGGRELQVLALDRLLRPQADVALAWGRAERAAGGRARGLRRLARRLHTRRWTTIEGLGPGMKGRHPQKLAASTRPAVAAKPSRLSGNDLPPGDAARTCWTSPAVIGCCCAQHPACRTSVHRRFRTRGTPWAWRTRTSRPPA